MIILSVGCRDKGSNSSAPVTGETWLTADNGNKIYSRWAYPSTGKQKFPAVIYVPGGLGSGTSFIEDPVSNSLLDHGYAIITFNAQGRGEGTEGDLRSDGEEDYNGHIQQDDLKTVIEAAQTMSWVDPDRIGIVSFSFGISMAAGCLGRHPGLNVRFLIDIEGPSDSYVIMGDPWLIDTMQENDKTRLTYSLFGRYSLQMDASASNVTWWSEREAVRYIRSIQVPYMRLQACWDHMQPPTQEYQDGFEQPPAWYSCKHAVDMINAAQNGSAPWTRMNNGSIGNTPNSLYSFDNQPDYFAGNLDLNSTGFSDILVKSVEEMFSLEP